MRGWTVLCMTVVACGGGDSSADAPPPAPPSETPSPAPAPAPAQPTSTGTVHRVRMLMTDLGEFKYVPDRLTIRAGDRVQWVNVNNGPHNVQFYGDSIPGGAASFLNRAMTDRMDDLFGPILTEPNAVYEIDFTGAPPGAYRYVCTPHELFGMKATLIVER